jgi:hypothetical protein
MCVCLVILKNRVAVHGVERVRTMYICRFETSIVFVANLCHKHFSYHGIIVSVLKVI